MITATKKTNVITYTNEDQFYIWKKYRLEHLYYEGSNNSFIDYFEKKKLSKSETKVWEYFSDESYIIKELEAVSASNSNTIDQETLASMVNYIVIKIEKETITRSYNMAFHRLFNNPKSTGEIRGTVLPYLDSLNPIDFISNKNLDLAFLAFHFLCENLETKPEIESFEYIALGYIELCIMHGDIQSVCNRKKLDKIGVLTNNYSIENLDEFIDSLAHNCPLAYVGKIKYLSLSGSQISEEQRKTLFSHLTSVITDEDIWFDMKEMIYSL